VTYTPLRVCVYTCDVYTIANLGARTFVDACVRTCIHAHILACVYIDVCVYACIVHIRSRACVYVRMHVYAHLCVCVYRCLTVYVHSVDVRCSIPAPSSARLSVRVCSACSDNCCCAPASSRWRVRDCSVFSANCCCTSASSCCTECRSDSVEI